MGLSDVDIYVLFGATLPKPYPGPRLLGSGPLGSGVEHGKPPG